ncbi:MAG: hypothetical protein Q4G05_03885 [Clostridia bacterium]|nr:hypothetical protein [Clostridia bacterium]
MALYIISGTLAKYVSNVYATDSARVAKFDYTVEGLDEETHEFSLFDTSSDTGVIGSASKLVAPGTDGSVSIEIENKSEVAIKAGFTLTETNSGNIPIVYEFGGNYYSSVLSETDTIKLHNSSSETVAIAGDLTDLATAIGDAAVLSKADGSEDSKTSLELAWAWAFEGSTGDQTDEGDTTLGETGTAEVSLRVDCDIEQLDVLP